jgi:hypothetical protein
LIERWKQSGQEAFQEGRQSLTALSGAAGWPRMSRVSSARGLAAPGEPYYSLSLLVFMPHSDDAELFHPAAERVRVDG